MNTQFSTSQSLPAKNYTSGNTCTKCSSKQRCLPYGLDERSVAQVDRIIGKRHWVERNELLLRVGEPFRCLYIIHGGQFKTFRDNAHGKQHVMVFHMAGEILGMSAISTGIHDSNAMALEDSEVCERPFAHMEELGQNIPSLQTHFFRLMSREIVRDQGVMLLLGNMRAEERLAAFLLNLSNRLYSRGFAANDFILRMSREEIGSYLGLKLETVSRTLSKFHHEGLILVEHKHIKILDPQALKKMVSGCAHAL